MAKKKVKSILLSLILTITLTFIGIGVVLSEGGSNGTDSSGTGSNTTCSSCTCTYTGRYLVYGVRISVVDWNTGNRKSGTRSIDIFESGPTRPAITSTFGIYTIPGDSTSKYNRMEMVGNIITQTSTNPTLSPTSWDAMGIVDDSDFEFQQHNVSFNYNNPSSKIVYSSFITSLYNAMRAEGEKEGSDYAFTNKIFRALGLNEITSYSDEELSETHLVIEPLVTFYFNGMSNLNAGLFYGTITQLAYATQAYNCDNDEYKNWSMADSILKEYNVIVYGQSPCNTTDDPEYCTPKTWGPVSSKPGSGKAARIALTTEHLSYGVGYIWLGGIKKADGCADVVGYLNNKYTTGEITKEQYDNYIDQVEAGSFSEFDEKENKKYTVSTPQTFELLDKNNYDRYNNGLAACDNMKKQNQSCDDAIKYINDHSGPGDLYPVGSSAYHNAVAQVKAGTFRYEVIENGKTVIMGVNGPSNFDKLEKNIYERLGGLAACENVDDACGLYTGGTVEIDDCETGKTYFKDIEDEEGWLKCEIAYTDAGTIYSSDNTGHDAVETTNGGIVGNKEYCEVFCYEEFETTFPTSVIGVRAGRTFTWGDPTGKFGSVTVRKKCSNQSYIKGKQGYRFEEWEEDYKDNERQLIRNYMEKASYEKQLDIIRTSSNWIYTDCCGCCYTVTTDNGSYKECPNNCKKRYSGTARVSGQSHTYSGSSYVGSVTGSVGSNSYTTGYSYMTGGEAEEAAKSTLEGMIQSNANAAYGRYGASIGKETELLIKIRQCTNNLEYMYETAIRFTFEEPINQVYGANSRQFEFDGELLIEEDKDPDNVDKSKCQEVDAYTYTCSGTGAGATCTAHQTTVLDCTVVTWNIYETYTYMYPTEKFQWYSLKTNAKLINEENKGAENADETFYYFIGFGLPTAFSLTEGTYKLQVTVDNIGDNYGDSSNPAQSYNKPNGHFGPVANDVNTLNGAGKGFEYICTYEVQNDIFGNDCVYDENGNLTPNSPEYCDPKKDEDSNGSLVEVDVAFRLITLLTAGDSVDKAFPGMDGNGRLPGENWKLPESDLKEILNADVYNNSAMYEIMLDVNAIQYIREDNQKYFDAGKDPYTSYVDENNAEKVHCVNGSTTKEKYCASDFISKLNTGRDLNYPLLGTCLPSPDSVTRAEMILNGGCNYGYVYPNINWVR